MVTKTLYLIRHAESTHNVKLPTQPESDFANCRLTPKGEEQARKIKGPTSLLLISPLRRTLATYHFSNLHVKKLETVSDLQEWTGWGESCMFELQDFKKRETWFEFQQRVARVVQLIRNRPENDITILSHGGVLGELMRQLQPNEPHKAWANAEVRRYTITFK